MIELPGTEVAAVAFGCRPLRHRPAYDRVSLFGDSPAGEAASNDRDRRSSKLEDFGPRRETHGPSVRRRHRDPGQTISPGDPAGFRSRVRTFGRGVS